MRLDVIRPHSGGFGDRLKNAELKSYRIKDFVGGHFQFLAPEIFTIEKARMRSNSDSAGLRCQNRSMHRIGIARVKTSRDARRADEVE